MPLILSSSHPSIQLYIWRRDEGDDFFHKKNHIRDEKWKEVLAWHPKRRSEWLAGRYLILRYAGCSSRDLYIDTHGKPQVQHSPIHLSISHSGSYVGIAISDRPVGIDIQMAKSTIDLIATKYTTDSEVASLQSILSNRTDILHTIWDAKEAMYKAYGRRRLNFKEDIAIDAKEGVIIGAISGDETFHRYTIWYHRIGDLYIASAIETV